MRQKHLFSARLPAKNWRHWHRRLHHQWPRTGHDKMDVSGGLQGQFLFDEMRRLVFGRCVLGNFDARWHKFFLNFFFLAPKITVLSLFRWHSFGSSSNQRSPFKAHERLEAVSASACLWRPLPIIIDLLANRPRWEAELWRDSRLSQRTLPRIPRNASEFQNLASFYLWKLSSWSRAQINKFATVFNGFLLTSILWFP